MKKIRTYGTRVGTRGAMGFRDGLNSTIKTAFRALAIGVMAVGALVAFDRNADATTLTTLTPDLATDAAGHYLGFVQGNSAGSMSEAEILSVIGLSGHSVIFNALLFYAKVDTGVSGSSTDGAGNALGVDTGNSPLGVLQTTFSATSTTSGTWTFAPKNALQEVTLLAIKAGSFFGLWFYEDRFNPGDNPQTGTFNAQSLYNSLIIAGLVTAQNQPGISHIEVFGDLSITTVIPLPPAALLFGTALFGLGALRRWKDKKDMAVSA